MRLRLSCLVLAAVALIAGACGGSKATPLETVRAASQETAAAKTSAFSMSIEGGEGPLANLTMDGAFDFGAHLAKLNVDGSKMGLSGVGKIPAIMDFRDGVIEYMKIEGLAEELDGKHWLKLDLGAAMKTVCPDIDFASLMKVQSGDPTSSLQQLAAADKVEVVGKEKVRDEDTTHYKVTIDIRKAAEVAPEAARPTMRQLASFYVDPIGHADLWLDGDGRARRVKQTVDPTNLNMPDCLKAAQASNPFKGSTTMTYEMYDFGKDVDISVPVANDVADLQDLARKQGSAG
jgi:hypothetical protein